MTKDDAGVFTSLCLSLPVPTAPVQHFGTEDA